MLLEEREDFFVGVALVAAHVDGEGALVGNDVVLCASIDDGDGILHSAKQFGALGERPFG